MHLSCFRVLTIANNAAMNTGYMYLFELEFLPRNGITGSYGSSVFSFLRKLLLFSIVAVPFPCILNISSLKRSSANGVEAGEGLFFH